ncbi:MAG: acyltransferase [Burkholderiales bacterium]|nr:acyltransferase [Burkholderiales bacterium]
MKKFNTLQSLRGIAALLVLLYHATWLSIVNNQYVYALNIFKQGQIGVDLFFVLSGFIIAYMHWSQINLKNGVVAKYWLKRFFRIYPLYWIIIRANAY